MKRSLVNPTERYVSAKGLAGKGSNWEEPAVAVGYRQMGVLYSDPLWGRGLAFVHVPLPAPLPQPTRKNKTYSPVFITI